MGKKGLDFLKHIKLPEPLSDEEYQKLDDKERANNWNDMGLWFPILESMGEFRSEIKERIPKTIWRNVNGRELWKMLDGEHVDHFDELVEWVMANKFDDTMFMRTGRVSGKHDWNDACYLNPVTVENVRDHLKFMIHWSGMTDQSFHTLFLREFLDLKPIMTLPKFKNMPVGKERRYFVDHGVIAHHPYWPPEAIIQGGAEGVVDNWKQKLYEINFESDEEITELTRLADMIGNTFSSNTPHDFWSIDFLWANDRWYITDMALGAHSYVWKDYTPESMKKELLGE